MIAIISRTNFSLYDAERIKRMIYERISTYGKTYWFNL